MKKLLCVVAATLFAFTLFACGPNAASEGIDPPAGQIQPGQSQNNGGQSGADSTPELPTDPTPDGDEPNPETPEVPTPDGDEPNPETPEVPTPDGDEPNPETPEVPTPGENDPNPGTPEPDVPSESETPEPETPADAIEGTLKFYLVTSMTEPALLVSEQWVNIPSVGEIPMTRIGEDLYYTGTESIGIPYFSLKENRTVLVSPSYRTEAPGVLRDDPFDASVDAGGLCCEFHSDGTCMMSAINAKYTVKSGIVKIYVGKILSNVFYTDGNGTLYTLAYLCDPAMF